MLCRCIDGYSRKIIWLKASYTNHKPELIASYFLKSVGDIGGFPKHVRTDCGTENVTVAAIQASVFGDVSAHRYGTSPGNQRIEAWWSFFRRNRSQFWLEVFAELNESGAFHPENHKEVECLRYCFMAVIQSDLDEIRRHWNTHRIRPSVGSRCPAGILDVLFYLPHPPAVDCAFRSDVQLPDHLLQQLEEPRACEDSNIAEYLQYLQNYYHTSAPHDTDSAMQLYFRLIPHLAGIN